MLKPKLLKTKILKLEASIDIRMLHFSHETNGAQFLIGPTRGEGGSGGFLEDLPKIGFKTETMV